MREIEFRAKTIPKLLGVMDSTPQYTNSEWVYGYYAPTYLFEKDGEIKNTYCIISDKFIGKQEMIGCGVNSGLPMVYDVMQDTLGQYTGKKDKNGKKIFDGDIIKSFQIFPNGERYEVIKQVEWMGDRFYPFANDELEYGNWWEELTKNCEVIGNIYDNPRLIGE